MGGSVSTNPIRRIIFGKPDEMVLASLAIRAKLLTELWDFDPYCYSFYIFCGIMALKRRRRNPGHRFRVIDASQS
jgi:hypothetical protein